MAAQAFCYFMAIQLCGAGLGTLLNYTHSVWANVLGVVFEGRRPKASFWILLTLAVIGLWLIIDPRDGADPWGLALGLTSGVLGGAAILTIKELRRSDSALTILSSLLFVGLLFSLPAVAWQELKTHPVLPWSNTWGLAALAAMAVLSFFGQALFTHGFKDTSVELGTLMSLTTPLAVANGHLFFGEALNARILAGALLILLACILASWSEAHETDRPR